MSNFGNKIIFILLLLCLSLFLYLKSKKVDFNYNTEILELFEKKEYKFIAHAAGSFDQNIYTNSLEALNDSINKGFKLIEVDLLETKDGHFVGINTWSDFKKDNLLDKKYNNDPMSFSEFKKVNILKGYTPLTTDIINKIFSENKDLILVTDKTNNFKKINQDFKFDNSRIIVEIFGKKNYFKSIKDGIVNPMFSASSNDYDFIIKNDIKLIAAHTKDIIKNKDVFKKIVKQGIKVMAYTSNNKKFINENLGITFSGVYTDYWDINKNDCLALKCITY